MRLSGISRALFAVAIVSPAYAQPPADMSWGKAGVPMDQYVRDSRECAETSRYVTTYIPRKTLRRLDALSSAQLLDTIGQIDTDPHGNPMTILSGVSTLRSADDIARRTNTFGAKYVAMITFDVRDQLQAVLDKCLIERGYIRIKLTRDQAGALHKLKRHSPERTAFLHAIDTDPSVVTAQAVYKDDKGG